MYLFSGTAEDYARYRPAYPHEMLDDLRRRAGVAGDGRLLDLACGPGRVALPLARHFGVVWAIDQEPEMIEVARARAERQGLTNIRWMVGRAEEVEAAPGSFELITIGEAFHRLDQQLIAERPWNGLRRAAAWRPWGVSARWWARSRGMTSCERPLGPGRIRTPPRIARASRPHRVLEAPNPSATC